MTTHVSAKPPAPDRRPTPWADVITLLGLLTAVIVIALGAVLAVAEDNGYGGREYLHDLVLTLLGIAALLYARAHVRDRIITAGIPRAGDAIYDDPPR